MCIPIYIIYIPIHIYLIQGVKIYIILCYILNQNIVFKTESSPADQSVGDGKAPCP